MIITSRENKIYKKTKMLKTAKGRSENKLFVIEGMRAVRDALLKKACIEYVIIKDKTFFELDFSCPVYTFAPKLFDDVSQTVTPQGIIAVCKTEEKTLKDIKDKNCIVMCQSLQDPGNIGTVIRTAHAADCGGVILADGCCDLYNPKIVRSTMTGIFSVPIVQNVTSKKAIEYFKKQGYKIIAGALCDNSRLFFDADLKGKHLIIVGNEANGITEETLCMCDKVLKIPMRTDAESLNAAVAASVMIYEHYRQNF